MYRVSITFLNTDKGYKMLLTAFNIHTHCVPYLWTNAVSLTLREEQRLRVFQNRMLKNIFEPARQEATGMETTT